MKTTHKKRNLKSYWKLHENDRQMVFTAKNYGSFHVRLQGFINVGDLNLVTIFPRWWQNLDFDDIWMLESKWRRTSIFIWSGLMPENRQKNFIGPRGLAS